MRKKDENKVVKFNSDLNKNILLSNLSGKEIDIFYAICIKLREIGEKTVKISFSELKALSNYTHKSKQRFFKDAANVCNNILTLKMKTKIEENRIIGTNIFSQYDLNSDTEELIIKLNNDFVYLFNNLKNNLTVFDIEESNRLKSKYPKIQLKNLREESTKGEYEEEYSDFTEKMGIVNTPANNITKRVLKPIVDELSKIFDDFQVIKEKKGREIIKLKWIWKESKDNPFEFFNNVFESIEVKFTYKIQTKIVELQKEKSKEDIEILINKAWEMIKKNPKIKNPPALLSDAITNIGLEEFINNSKEMEHKIECNKESAQREKKWEKEKQEYNNQERKENIDFIKFQELPQEEREEMYINAQKMFEEKTGNPLIGKIDNTITIMCLMPFIKYLMKEKDGESA